AGHFAGLTAKVARNSPPGMQLFIQIPDCERIFSEGAFEDIYYEHCNYFTEASLVGLFARHGFAVEAVSREYAGQYLTMLARFTGTRSAGVDADEIARLRAMVQRFGAIHAERVAGWRQLVRARQAACKRVVLWGSGSKGVTFLGALGEGDGVSHVVDINPHRQGHYMVGTGHPIVAPEALVALQPATVIVMNAVYRAEVAAQLAGLGLDPELLSL
ncbi:MAG: C-methyltransferase, partial [Belnapia sp.]|nr:C-methyltransferase [Belnapia sp.]